MRLVEVEWQDPRGLGGGSWVKYDDLDGLDLTASGCKTVGYVLRETETELVLFSSLAHSHGELDEVGDGLVIPKACVDAVYELARVYEPIVLT
jgi:hypothetical protein